MNTRTAIAMGACLTLASLSVSAQPVEGDVEASGDGYIATGGMVLKTGMGDCLQTGSYSEDNMINKCAGIEDEEVADAAADTDAAAEEEAVAAVEEEAPAAPVQTATIDTREFSEMALFDTNSAELNADGSNVMSSLFDALSEYKGITAISVVGHTDSRGAEDYNMALSEQRAATVAAEIGTQYPGANINVSGMGEASPIASNDTAEGRQQNRRVEIEITATRMTFN
ncbi:MAG: OmpA family protein [Granulosicoccus sp.]